MAFSSSSFQLQRASMTMSQAQRMRSSRCDASRCGMSPRCSEREAASSAKLAKRKPAKEPGPRRHEPVLDAVKALAIFHARAAKKAAVVEIAPGVIGADDAPAG